MRNLKGGKQIPEFQNQRKVKSQDLAIVGKSYRSQVSSTLAVLLFQDTGNTLIGVFLNSFLLPKDRNTNNALLVILASRDL